MSAWLVIVNGRGGRLLSLLLLMTIWAAHLPLPYRLAKPVGKDRSRPFPCQDRPCGCRTAEQCWQRCCCFSREQRLAWLQQYAIRVPQQAQRKSCCQYQKTISEQPHVSRKRVMETSLAHAGKSCCQPLLQSGYCPKESPHRQDDRPAHEDEGVAILAFVAHPCQGQLWGWNTFACQAVPLDSDPACPVSGPPQASLSITSDLLLARALEPPVPPPRLSDHGRDQV